MKIWILDGYQSQGNSFFGKGGRNNKRSQLKYILRLLRSLVSTKDERLLMDLCDQGIIPSITGKKKRKKTSSLLLLSSIVFRIFKTYNSTEISSNRLC